ncbi:hypothetical protein [Bradyrhizobium paxllaeri]|uniref:hypothetical protein n=1 Tax=Bradyrhizobium paxllaeri TaxID=190148 RepID=UPI001146651C|nr:hypothetical protein [Bradyrhizobium paxllaeri]
MTPSKLGQHRAFALSENVAIIPEALINELVWDARPGPHGGAGHRSPHWLGPAVKEKTFCPFHRQAGGRRVRAHTSAVGRRQLIRPQEVRLTPEFGYLHSCDHPQRRTVCLFHLPTIPLDWFFREPIQPQPPGLDAWARQAKGSLQFSDGLERALPRRPDPVGFAQTWHIFFPQYLKQLETCSKGPFASIFYFGI